MKKIRIPSGPRAKVKHQWPPGSALMGQFSSLKIKEYSIILVAGVNMFWARLRLNLAQAARQGLNTSKNDSKTV